ncbi:MAG: hypothetical protein L3J08_06375 [Flavobacteriaceae bacterium]|nr:hypothetical protein [Flavobacteriaceae bacterium]
MIIWHPYQKLWNIDFLKFINKAIPNKYIVGKTRKGIILLDTLLLLLRSLKRDFKRNKKYGNLFNIKDVPINYFDIGTHKKGSEIEFIIKNLFDIYNFNYHVYAFEASPTMAYEAKEALKSFKEVRVTNLALCEDVPESGVIKLYKSAGGLGNSFYKNDSNEYEESPADSLSNFIRNNKINLSSSINILRMNIEGAELGVLKDLYKNDLLKYFNGYYGMWDDLEKIDNHEQKYAKAFLKKINIDPFTFNGRDLKFNVRKKVILRDIKSAIRVGVVCHNK